jgi:hypothetical protein
MDLLRSLIVPPALPDMPTSALSQDQQHFHGSAATSSQSADGSLLPTAPTQPTTPSLTEEKSASAPTQKQKRKKQKQRQQATKIEQSKKAVAQPIVPVPAGITKASKRKWSQFFHPDRPKGGINKRTAISYEDLYDDAPVQQP